MNLVCFIQTELFVILHYLNTDEIPRQNIKCSATNEITWIENIHYWFT